MSKILLTFALIFTLACSLKVASVHNAETKPLTAGKPTCKRGLYFDGKHCTLCPADKPKLNEQTLQC
jgi:hypothetical protein